MNFWVKYLDNGLVSLDFQNQGSGCVIKCNLFSVDKESLSKNKSIDFQLPLVIDTNNINYISSVSRIFCEEYTVFAYFVNRPLLLVLYQDPSFNLICYQLDVENEVINTVFTQNCKERIESVIAGDGPIITYTTSTCLYAMISDYFGYFKIYQYQNNNNNSEILYLGNSLCSSTVIQQLIVRNINNNNSEYRVLDIDLFNESNPIIESEFDSLYTLLDKYKISSIMNESDYIILITDDNKVVVVSKENYDEVIVVVVENANFIRYYQPNYLYKGFIINCFEIIDLESEKQIQLLIPNEKIENLKDIIIVSDFIVYTMNDNSVYITDSYITKQYNTIDNSLINIIDDGDVMKKVISSISLKYNEMVENILDNIEVEEKKTDLINQIFNKDISLNKNQINLKYDRSKLNSFISSNISMSDIENIHSLSSKSNEIMNNKKCELLDNKISIIYDNIIGIELKINNCSKSELNNCEIMVISNGILYSNVYNIEQQTEHILPSQSIDIQIECNLNHSENVLPSYINIYIVCNIKDNEYIEYLISYNLSDVVSNHKNTLGRVDIYNETVLLWRENIPKDIEKFPNIKVTKMNEKCYKIQYNSNDALFMLLIKKYEKNCTCDIYSLLENVDFENYFDVFSNEINSLSNNYKIESSEIKTSQIMNYIHKIV